MTECIVPSPAKNLYTCHESKQCALAKSLLIHFQAFLACGPFFSRNTTTVMLSKIFSIFKQKPQDENHPASWGKLDSKPSPKYSGISNRPKKKPLPHDHEATGRALKHVHTSNSGSRAKQVGVLNGWETRDEKTIREMTETEEERKELQNRVDEFNRICAAQFQ